MSKSVHIDKIKDGLREIQKVGHTKEEFSIFGNKIKIRTLKPREREKARERSHPFLQKAKEEDDPTYLQRWVNRLKVEILSFAIIEIGDVDLEGVDYITTDKVNEKTNKPIKKEKHIYMREFLENWHDEIITIAFKKFREITRKKEREIGEEVEFEEEDIEAKINQKEEELENLRQQKKEMEKSSDKELVDEELGEGVINENQLKEEMFSPEKAEEIEETQDIREVEFEEVNEKRDNQEAEKKKVRKEPEFSDREEKLTEKERLQREGYAYKKGSGKEKEVEEIEYVDEFGNPLEGEELERAKEMDRLYEEKYGEEIESPSSEKDQLSGDLSSLPEDKERKGNPQTQTKKEESTENQKTGREPLNKQEARIKEGTLPEQKTEEEKRQRRREVQKTRRPKQEEKEEIPVAESFSDIEPESLSPDQRATQKDIQDLKTNPDPKESDHSDSNE